MTNGCDAKQRSWAKHHHADGLMRKSAVGPQTELTEEEVRVLDQGGVGFSQPQSLQDASTSGSESATTSATESRFGPTAAKHAALVASALTVDESAALLGVSESHVRQRVSDRTLYSLKTSGERRLARFQFTEDGEVPTVGDVMREIPKDAHPVSVSNWFTSPNPDLSADGGNDGRLLSPREWLLSGGDPEALVPLAREL